MNTWSLRIGCDVVTMARIQALWMYHRSRMLEAFLTVAEWAECLSLHPVAGEPVTDAQHRYIAARFAAKEAVIKALRPDTSFAPEYSEIEVLGESILNVRLDPTLQEHACRMGLLYWTGSAACAGPNAMACVIAVCSHD